MIKNERYFFNNCKQFILANFNFRERTRAFSIPLGFKFASQRNQSITLCLLRYSCRLSRCQVLGIDILYESSLLHFQHKKLKSHNGNYCSSKCDLNFHSGS